MASLPRQQPSRRSQSSQQPDTDESPQETQRNNSETQSNTSLDSQTIFLNRQQSDSLEQRQDQSARKTAETAPALPRRKTQDEPRKCWICFSDETEDTSESSVWRTPCPCALTAHESCLLDWIADIEAPNSSQGTSTPAEIRCPQCKSKIHLTRPNSALVKAYGGMEKWASRVRLPAFAAGTVYTLLLAMSHHGEHTVRTIFSAAEAEAILAPRTYSTMNILEQEALAYFPSVFGPLLRNWRGLRVELGLPLIPAALIASRTTIADAVLPVLPIIFFATHAPSSQTLSIGYWPPSAALTLVALPYIRSAYDEYIERVWAKKEQAWIKEIAPRLGENDAEDGNSHHRHDDDDFHDHDGFDLELELVEIEEEEEEPGYEHGQGNGGEGAAPAPNVPVADEQGWNRAEAADPDLADAVEVAVDAQARDNAGARQDQANGNQNENQGRRERRQEHHIDLFASAQKIADTVFGALLFPSVAAGSGEVLRMLLPHSWTVVPKRAGGGPPMPTGLLQTKWGRSIIGGCLFVVFKDAVRIYCRWRMAVSFRARRVRDYDKVTGKLV